MNPIETGAHTMSSSTNLQQYSIPYWSTYGQCDCGSTDGGDCECSETPDPDQLHDARVDRELGI